MAWKSVTNAEQDHANTNGHTNGLIFRSNRQSGSHTAGMSEAFNGCP